MLTNENIFRFLNIESENGKKFTFNQLLNDCLKVAAALKKAQLKPGEIFMVYGFNCYEYVVAIISGLLVGGIGLPIRGADTSSEFHNELTSKDVRLLFISAHLKDAAFAVKNNLSQIKEVILFDGIERDGDLKCIQSILRNEKEVLAENEIYDPKGNQESIALILESSGTTGATKGAKLAYYDLATLFSSSSPLDKNRGNDEILLAASPVAHLSGMTSHFYSLTHGTTLVTLRQNTLENNVNAIEKYRITRAVLSPSMMTQMLKLDPPANLKSLKSVFIGGARLPKGIGEEFVKKFDIKDFHNAYTMTEITILATLGENVMGNYHAIGKVCPGMQIKIVDIETGKILGENENGEIRVKGPLSFKGYYKKEKLSEELIDSDEIIKQNSFGFSPVDLEEILLQHEAVKEAAVVGIPDIEAGELAHAFIILKDNYQSQTVDKQSLIDFVNNRVTHLKQLKGDVHFVKDFPRTGFGKILRRKIRDQFMFSLNNNYVK
ncbi:4-coumarate--CoA ligase 1-like protein [Leptotrombidium deliense]|uniref:4-coumarate--CoA ligase 1-like protein n=1 Tax=Leptotrombidium deliense TaxID=299467 RepID=A0A443S7J2_9ACAR|nr:4-coumarate--CoA ligase 1-like protein [Leptotrombidium deliense]